MKQSIRAAIAVLVMMSVLTIGIVPGAAAPPGMPGHLNLAYTVDPAQPVVGQTATVRIRIFAVGGPLNLALVASFSLSAVSDSGQALSAAASALPNGPGGTYAATLTFPAAGVWHLSTTNFANAPGNAFDVTVLDAPASGVPACHAADLGTDIQWQGALGSRIGTLTLINNGAAPCLLAGYPAMRIEDEQGQTVPAANNAFAPGDDSGGDLLLQPGQQAKADVRWVNRCPQATASDTFRLRVSLDGDSDSFTVVASPPPCFGDTRPSGFDQRSFELIGDGVRVVRDYYAAINRRDYRAAYALFGAQMQQNQSYSDFAAGFATTQRDDLHISALRQTTDGSVVTITLTARLTDGTTQHYTGAYTVGQENGASKIVAASIALQ